MAAFGSSSMVGDNKIGAKAVFLMIWIHFLLITGAAAIPREELDDMIPVLRLRGFNLFGNAIKTSDLTKDCLALENLTLFAPPDESMEMARISGDSGLRPHDVHRRLAVSNLILLPSPTILATLLPSHSLSISVRGTRRTVHIAVNGVPLESPGLYHSSHGLVGALIPPLSHIASCCLPQSPIRATLVQTPSRSAYAVPRALSNGDLLPPRPPETLDISIGFSTSSTIAALTAAAFAAGVFIHLCNVPIFSSPDDDMFPGHELVDDMLFDPELDNDTDDGPELVNDGPELVNDTDGSPELDSDTDDTELDNAPAGPDRPRQVITPARPLINMDENKYGFLLIIQMILNTLRRQLITVVRVVTIDHHDAVYPVNVERLGARLVRYYISRLKILTQPQYVRYRTPDDVILAVEMPDWTRLHIGPFPYNYFINSPIFDNTFVVRIIPAPEGSSFTN